MTPTADVFKENPCKDALTSVGADLGVSSMLFRYLKLNTREIKPNGDDNKGHKGNYLCCHVLPEEHGFRVSQRPYLIGHIMRHPILLVSWLIGRWLGFADQMISALLPEVQDILERRWHDVERIAELLLKHRQVTPEMIDEVLLLRVVEIRL